MSDFSPILVLQIKICIKPDRHGKGSNKIWETHSFWRNFFNNGAIWLQTLICNRLNPWFEMQAVWVSIQWNHPFANERLLLWRLMYWGCNYSFDEPSLASPDTSHLFCVLPQVAWWGKGILCVFVAIFAALHPLLPQCRYLFDLCVILWGRLRIWGYIIIFLYIK